MAKSFQKPVYCWTSTLSKAVLFFLLSALSIAEDTAPTLETQPATVQQETALLPYSAEYRAKFNGLSANTERQLTRDAKDQWKLSQQAKLLFLRVNEESQLHASNTGLTPLHYNYENSMASRHNQHIVFDWENNVAFDNKAKSPWKMPLQPDFTDQLSAQLQMREALISGRFTSTLSQTIIGKKGRIKTYVLEILGEEVIDTPAGKLNTVKLSRHREGREDVTLVWLAKDWNYLIVRLEQQEEEDTFLLELLNARVDGKVVGPAS